MQIIFCVEDDDSIRELIAYALKSGGFAVRGFADGESFFTALREEQPHLVLLDIMLPGDNGLMVLRRLRDDPHTAAIPVILLTAKATEYDKVKGLDLGADDYVTKPFGVMELISRVNAVLRRAGRPQDDTALRCGGIVLDSRRRTVLADGEAVRLTHKEFELLMYLMRNQGIVLSRDKLIEAVWDFDFEGESRTVDMHIKSLRQKLGPQGALIRTVRSVGYSINGEAP